jgi:hypothetical protein
MKNRNNVYSDRLVFVVFFLFVLSGFLASGCIQPLEEIQAPPEGVGQLSVSIISADDSGGRGSSGLARTMLAVDPLFTSYELQVTRTDSGKTDVYLSQTASFQLDLPVGAYTITATGFSGDKPTAKGWNPDTGSLGGIQVTINSADSTKVDLSLAPYADLEVYGTLQYSLAWDTVGQIPSQAELLIEQYNNNGTPEDPGDDTWEPISVSLMNENITVGSRRGAILLLQRATGLIKQTGTLDLPPGEYRLTTTVAMDNPYPPVSRIDIAHIFSNLITPAAFIYGSGDLIVTNPGTDTGSGFITRFNFSQTPNAVSIIGSNPGPDGTRLIMVTVPSSTDLTRLTPVVECAPGASVTSPPPLPGPDGLPIWAAGDYSRPTTWVAQGANGVTQQYTVVVSKAAEGDCAITDLAFSNAPELSAPQIKQTTDPGEIEVTVPYGTNVASLKPVFSYIGKGVKLAAGDSDPSSSDTDLSGVIDFTSPLYFRVYAEKDGITKLYKVTVKAALNGDAEITGFVIDGYPERPGNVTQPVPPGSVGTIEVTLPYGTNLANLKPLVTYKGNLSPASGVEQNFNVPVVYTVTSQDGVNTKTYNVTVKVDAANTNTGIFDFVITNVPKAKVVIGTKPRADGKIPIVVQVPYATSPLISPTPEDGPRTDLRALIPKITLSSSGSSITFPTSYADGQVLPFNDQNDYQEAVYTVTAQAGNTQDYVVVVARDVHYYYVKATGNDTDPDQYNGGSESMPFKTLAHAVYQAVKHNVDHIYVIGTLNDATEGGAWENTSMLDVGTSGGVFNSSGASATGGGASVFNLIGAGRNGAAAYPIYITGVGSNAVLQGVSGKRVISVTGGAHITFENITIRDGGGVSYGGNGGGVYTGGNSTVVWKSGAISNNQAASGGGLYVDNSEFDFHTGSISGNTATGKAIGGFTTNAISIQGGGGVYLNGEDSLFWLAAGDISNNTTSGSGGGVLVNGSVIPNSPKSDELPYNFIMSAGTITGNNSKGAEWPGGGGGVYVAKGTFQMLSGQISGNQSTRQGGGVFVWSRSLFLMDGNSFVVNNQGVGSSKAICSRGITTMRGSAQADTVYIWNYAKGPWNNGWGDEFTMMEGARITGLELAFADDPQDNRNYVNIIESDIFFPLYFTGTDRITTIGLESRLTSNGSFDKNATIAGDWLGKYLIKNNGAQIPADQVNILLPRFPLDSYIYGGANPIRLTNYKLDNTGKLVSK